MKTIILAAGYANSMGAHTKDAPSALLPIRGRPAIELLLEKIQPIRAVDEIFIVVNQRFSPQFQTWLNDYIHRIPIRIIENSSRTQKDSFGPCRDLAFVIERASIVDDSIVAGADNIFSFGLLDFIAHALGKKPYSSIATHDVNGKFKSKRYGVLRINELERVIDFYEKPSKRNGSSLISTCLYFLPKEKLPTLNHYLSLNTNGAALGDYIKWLSQNDVVFAFNAKGEWFDLGDEDSYTEAIFKF